MEETAKSLIDRITIKYDKPKTAPSGKVCQVYYDCLSLTPNDLARLAAEAVGHLDNAHFDMAVGIAYNGIFFAAAVAAGREVGILKADQTFIGPDIKGKKIILVDDVVLSGTRMKNAEKILSDLGGIVIAHACIVDRSDGKLSSEEKPLFSAHQTCMS